MELIESLVQKGWLETPQVIEAFRKIKRKDFFPEGIKDFSELDEAFPIGEGQTISQPLVVAFMIEQLKVKRGDKVLDIGSGSGWTTALLAELAGKEGKIIALEVIKELKETGEKNVHKYGFLEERRVKFFCADGSKGYKKEAPYDRILVSASAKEVPLEWKKQLKTGGRIVASVGNSIWTLEKKGDNDFEIEKKEGFVFVPLVSK